jgi:ribonucleoside-diphosphate reductase alpha chain
MIIRERLTDRRSSDETTVEHAGQSYVVGVGYYADGRPGEVFINTGKTSESIHQHAADAAVILSIGLQHGIPAEAFARSMPRHDDGTPYTIIGAVADMLAERVRT